VEPRGLKPVPARRSLGVGGAFADYFPLKGGGDRREQGFLAGKDLTEEE